MKQLSGLKKLEQIGCFLLSKPQSNYTAQLGKNKETPPEIFLKYGEHHTMPRKQDLQQWLLAFGLKIISDRDVRCSSKTCMWKPNLDSRRA